MNNDITVGDFVSVNPHGEGSIHFGTVTKIYPDKYGDVVEVNQWVSRDGGNKVSGKVGFYKYCVKKCDGERELKR